MKKQILLIDDDGDEVSFLCEALQHAGIDHSCTWSEDVQHALNILRYFRPTMIFIDLNMPRISGIEGIRMIRELPDFSTLPILLYSTTVDADRQQEALNAGATACLVKACDPKRLAACIRGLELSCLNFIAQTSQR